MLPQLSSIIYWVSFLLGIAVIGQTDAPRALFRDKSRRNWASEQIAPVKRARQNEHLPAFSLRSLIGLLRNCQKRAKIGCFCHFSDT